MSSYKGCLRNELERLGLWLTGFPIFERQIKQICSIRQGLFPGKRYYDHDQIARGRIGGDWPVLYADDGLAGRPRRSQLLPANGEAR